jgi:nucleoside-diphosphate-sugar epimerase
MAEAIALARQISGRELAVEQHSAAVGDVRRTKADVEKSRTELRWEPRTPLLAGLAEQWAWVTRQAAASLDAS